MRVLRVIPILLVIGAAPPPQYILDAGRSDISAKVAFFGLSSKTARFPKASGSITLDPAAPDRIDLRVELDASALTAPDPVTLSRLKGPKFFDVARHPTIAFDGKSMRMTGSHDAEVAGTVTARGVAQPAILAVRFDTPPSRVDGRTPLRITGTTTIDRRRFGMTAYPLVVGRNVTITLRVTMVPS